MTTLLQITDPHLLSQPKGTLKGVPTAESLKLVLRRAREEIRDPDHVVLTGDLCHDHSLDGYRLLKALLEDWADRALLIPGNHDDRDRIRSVFQQTNPDGNAQPGEEVGFCADIGRWRLVGLDTHVPGEVFGELSNAMLRKLSRWLEECDQAIVFLHHPPVRVGSAWLDRIGLRNTEALTSILDRRRNVRGVFCGHIHQVFEGHVSQVPLFCTPSASVQFSPQCDKMKLDHRPPGFRVIELDDDATVRTRVIRLDQLTFAPCSE